MPGEFRFGIDFARLRADLLQQIVALERADEAMKKAHQRSVDWLGQRAASNLKASRRRARDPRNVPGLETILTSPEVSKVTSHGFEYLIPEAVAALSARTAAYYRVIEGLPGDDIGTEYWVEKTFVQRFGLLFFGDAGPGGGQAAVGSWINSRFPQVRIRKPVPAYHYVFNARTSFIKANLYYRWSYEQLRLVGIPVVTRGRPGG